MDVDSSAEIQQCSFRASDCFVQYVVVLELFAIALVADQRWIGLSDEGNEDNFIWLSDQGAMNGPVEWCSDEPNDAGDAEDCAMLNSVCTGKLNDLSCEISSAFICQYIGILTF